MATKVSVNGKFQTRPGVYATIRSGIKNPPQNQPYGNILIIDDGIGAGFGGGSGINGALQTGVNSVYSFDSLQDYRSFTKGGALWNLGLPLFKPSANADGASKVFLIKAASTTIAEVAFTLTNGSFTIQTKDEGVNANGVLASTNLSQGIGAKIIQTRTGFYALQIWHGTYKGLDAVNNTPYDGVLNTIAAPQLIVQSPEFTTVAQMIAWMSTSPDFNGGFTLKAGSTATGAIVIGDVTNGYILAAGATEVYGSTDFDAALAAINNLDFTHILAMGYGATATNANNAKIFDFVVNNSKYERLMVVAGGFDKTEFVNSSIVTANYYNSPKVICIHGGIKKTNRSAPSGFSVYNQLYHAAAVLGRAAGLPSQVPVTLKSISIADGFVHPMTDAEQETAIAQGVMYSYYDYELQVNVIGLGINTLKNNDYLVNDDGTTYNWALMRISAELNKSIVVAGKKRFFDPNGLGGNRNSTSAEEAIVWLKGFLLTKTASALQDNLIILTL